MCVLENGQVAVEINSKYMNKCYIIPGNIVSSLQGTERFYEISETR